MRLGFRFPRPTEAIGRFGTVAAHVRPFSLVPSTAHADSHLELVARACHLLNGSATVSAMDRGRLPSARGNSTADLDAWRGLSDRASFLLKASSESSAESPGSAAWLLDAMADADLHPGQKSALSFPKSFREVIKAEPAFLDAMSDDEFCIAWSALDRLQLLDKSTSLMFAKAAMVKRDGESSERHQGFSAQNLLRAGQGMRELAATHPMFMEFAEVLMLRLLVDANGDFASRNMQLSALNVVSRMARLNSRSIHRITAAVLSLLPRMTTAELVTVPRLCARAGLQDETLHITTVQAMVRAFAVFEVHESVAVWRAVMRWRVGLPGMQRSAAPEMGAALAVSWAASPPPAAAVLRQLRALGRLDAPFSKGEGHSRDFADGSESKLAPLVGDGRVALTRAFSACLSALPAALSQFGPHDLVLCANAFGQVARAWSWLDLFEVETSGEPGFDDDVRETTEAASNAASFREHIGLRLVPCMQEVARTIRWELDLAEASVTSDPGVEFSARDLGLVVLAFARISRRGDDAFELLATTTQYFCERLESRAAACSSTYDVDESMRQASSAAMSAASMLLMQVSRVVQIRPTADSIFYLAIDVAKAAFRCMMAWFLVAPTASGNELHKAVAASAAFGGSILDEKNVSSERLDHIFPLVHQTLSNLVLSAMNCDNKLALQTEMGQQLEAFEAWHLDGCLVALSVLDAIPDFGWLVEAEEEFRAPSKPPHGHLDMLRKCRSALIEEICARRATIAERNVRFWSARLLSLPERRIASELAAKLENLEADEPVMDVVAAAALRDFAFVLSQKEAQSL